MMIHIFWRGLRNIFLIFLPYVVKRCTVLHDVQNVPSNYFMIFLNLIIFYRCADIVRLLHMQPITHIPMPMFPGAYFLHVWILCTWSGHGAAAVSLPGGFAISWWRGRVAGRPRLRDLTHVRMNLCIFFSFWYYSLILNINHISDEKKIIYMCLPIVYMILPVFYCFYYMFFLFACIHALSEMTKWNCEISKPSSTCFRDFSYRLVTDGSPRSSRPSKLYAVLACLVEAMYTCSCSDISRLLLQP